MRRFCAMSPSYTPKVFVTGVTGKIGFHVAQRLRDLNWSVRATARDLKAPRAVTLAALGVELTKGDWDDEDALRKSIEGCDKLFLNLTPDWWDMDHEWRQAETIIRVARDAGVQQAVSSTSLGVCMYPDDTRLGPETLLYPMFKAKKEVERVVKDAGFASHTFLRPAYFMANFLEPDINVFTDILTEGVWSSTLLPDTKIGLTDHDDIAQFAVAAFREPQRFNARVLVLASELLTPQETMDRLGQAMGRPLTAKFLSDDEIAALPYGPSVMPKCATALRYMIEYLDMDELSTIVPRLTSFEEFLDRERDSVKKLG